MPIEILVTYADGKKEMLYIPLGLMYGSKKESSGGIQRTDLPAWPWTHPSYVIELKASRSNILSIEIEPTQRMADVDRSNNSYKLPKLVPGPGK